MEGTMLEAGNRGPQGIPSDDKIYLVSILGSHPRVDCILTFRISPPRAARGPGTAHKGLSW